MGGANIQIVHFFYHGYLKEEKSMIHSFTVTFGVKYLTGMVTSVPPYETFSLINFFLFLRQSKIYKNYFKNSNFWGMWPLGHVGHVTYSFINILFISLLGLWVFFLAYTYSKTSTLIVRNSVFIDHTSSPQ